MTILKGIEFREGMTLEQLTQACGLLQNSMMRVLTMLTEQNVSSLGTNRGVQLFDRSIGGLQIWQDSRVENLDSSQVLKLQIYIPGAAEKLRLSRIVEAKLRFQLDYFRAWSTSAASGGGSTATADSTGAHPHDTFGYVTGYTETLSDTTIDGGHHHHYYRGGGTMSVSGTAYSSGTHGHPVPLPNHSHGLVYGIYISGYKAAGVRVTINGVDRTTVLGGPFDTDQSGLNIAPYLVESWNSIELSSSQLGRIDAALWAVPFLEMEE